MFLITLYGGLRYNIVGMERMFKATEIGHIGGDAFANVRDTLDVCYQATGDPREVTHPLAVLKTAMAYVPTLCNPGVRVAACLHDVNDRATRFVNGGTVSGKPVPDVYLRALYDFYNKETYNPSSPTSPFRLDYMVPLLDDMPRIGHAADLYREVYTDGNGTVTAVMRARPGEYIDITPEDWLQPFDFMHPPQDMLRETKKVNVESIILNAIELLVNLRRPSPNPKAVMQDAYGAMSFYSPVLSVMGVNMIGLEVLATALRSVALATIVERAGRLDLLDKNRNIIGVANRALERVADILIPDMFLDSSSGDPEIYASMGTLQRPGNYGPEGFWRIKSEGAGAYKELGYELNKGMSDVTPPDIIGLTIVVDDWQEAALELKNIVGRIRSASDMCLSVSPTAKDDVGVIPVGDGEHIGILQQVFSGHDIEICQPKRKPESVGFKAYKIYAEVVHEGVRVPVEVQAVSRAAYEENKIGEGSHVSYKAGISGVGARREAAEQFRLLSRRIGRVSRNGQGVNPHSVERSFTTFSNQVDVGAQLAPL